MPTAIVPGIYDPSSPTRISGSKPKTRIAMCRRLAREEALLVGISSGANLVAAREGGAEIGGSRRAGRDRHRSLRRRVQILERTVLA